MYVIGLQVYFVNTFKLQFGKQEGVSVLQRKTSSARGVLLCESDDQQCKQQQHMMKIMTITCLNLTPICISVVHRHQFWFYKGASMLHQCTDAPSPCPPSLPRTHSLCSAQAQILLVDIFVEQHHH